jgi:uncharacterized protein (TIGR03084 family)
MVDVAELLKDLADESADVDSMVAPLSDVDWSRPTPAEGWTVAHQIAHLTWTDHNTLLAATDPPAFTAQLGEAATNFDGYVDRGAEEFLAPPPELLARWRDGRAALAGALSAAPPGTRLPWYVGPMSVASTVTARLMETWAHGLDIAETFGHPRPPTRRLKHIAHLGARTVANSFVAHGMEPPADPVRVEVTGPEGEVWGFGPEDAANRVTGPAIDFCLLVTQRRHRADLALTATGPVADAWLDIAQVFAGPPGPGRPPGGA